MAVGNSLRFQNPQMPAPVGQRVPHGFEGPLPEPTRDMAQLLSDLDRAGYAIAADVFDAAKANEMRQVIAAEIVRETELDESRVRSFYTDNDDRNRRLNQLVNRHRWFREILEHPLPLAITRHMLGPQTLNDSYLVHSYAANITMPGSAAQSLHRDRSGAIALEAGPLQTRFIWCIDDFDEENGATRLVPGSHRRFDLPGYGGNLESVPAECQKGSVLIYTDLLMHGTGENVSADRQRAGVIAGYCPPWWKPMINFPLTTDPAMMKDASVTLRQLLGYSSDALGFDEPWVHAAPDIANLVVPARMTW